MEGRKQTRTSSGGKGKRKILQEVTPAAMFASEILWLCRQQKSRSMTTKLNMLWFSFSDQEELNHKSALVKVNKLIGGRRDDMDMSRRKTIMMLELPGRRKRQRAQRRFIDELTKCIIVYSTY